MPRKKGEWEEARAAFLGIQGKERSVEEREHMPAKACGKCKHFYLASILGVTGGDCLKLKTGSNISVDPPVFVLEGDTNLQTEIRMDAGRCSYFEQMEIVDKDISEAFDPRYSRYQRQMMD